MPRAAWVALGAVLVAIVGGDCGVGRRAGPVSARSLLAAARDRRARVPPRGAPAGGSVRRRRRRLGAVPLLVGVALVAVRLAVGGPGSASTVGLPAAMSGDGPWAGIGDCASVRHVTAARSRPLELRSGASGSAPSRPIRVAATLPRYPAIRPGLTGRDARPARAAPATTTTVGTWPAPASPRPSERPTSPSSARSAMPATASKAFGAAADDALTRALPEPEAGLASGILIGLRDRVDRDLADGVRDGGCQPRRRDLGLEHRHRRRGDRARSSGAGRADDASIARSPRSRSTRS